MNKCTICGRWVEKSLQEEKCPHQVQAAMENALQSDPAGAAQRAKAGQELLGQKVWFQPLRDRQHTVMGSDRFGMVTLDGLVGPVSAHWCVKAI